MFSTIIDPFDLTRCPLFQSCCKTAGDGVRYYIDKFSNVKKKKKPRCLLDLESLETIAHEHLKKWPERLIGNIILTNEGWIKTFAQHIKLNTQTKTALLIRCSYLVAPWVLDLLVTPVQAGLALLSDPWFLWTQTHTQNIVAEKTNTTNLKQSCCGAISTQFELQLVRLVQMPKHDKVSKWGHTCGTFIFVNGLLITLHSFSIMYNQDDSSVRYQVCTYFERCTLSRWSGNRPLHCGFVQLSNNSTHHIFDDFKTETRGF